MTQSAPFTQQILALAQTALEQGKINYPGKTQIYDLEDLHAVLREALEDIEKRCQEQIGSTA